MILTDLIYYDLKVAALIAVFYLFYQLLLARETMHTLNRAVLLAAIGLSVVLPLCVMTLHETVIVDNMPLVEMEETLASNVSPTPVMGTMGHDYDRAQLVAILLVTGILIRLFVVARSYWKLHCLIAHSERHTLPTGTHVCVVEVPVAPFSWMHTVVLSRAE